MDEERGKKSSSSDTNLVTASGNIEGQIVNGESEKLRCSGSLGQVMYVRDEQKKRLNRKERKKSSKEERACENLPNGSLGQGSRVPAPRIHILILILHSYIFWYNVLLQLYFLHTLLLSSHTPTLPNSMNYGNLTISCSSEC